MTPETLLAHELVGLRVRVVEATNDDLLGLAGRVVSETTNTLRVEPARGERVRTVPKAVATLEFELPSGEFVVVDGSRLVARPARRPEDTMAGTTWHTA